LPFIQPGNRAGPLSEEKISNGGDKKGKSQEKRLSGEAYDMNKQTIYIALKSSIESRAHYALEPTWGNKLGAA